MRRKSIVGLMWLLGICGTVFALPAARAQQGAAQPQPVPQLVDRIVARIEDDVITFSEMRELAAYQQLLEEMPQPDDRLLSELIEQWALNLEATAAQFPVAATAEVDAEMARIEKRFSTPQAYEQRLSALGITRETVRRIVARQLFLARYIDYKFRPAVQLDDVAIDTYYRRQFVPALVAKRQAAPPLEEVSEQIRELLVQQGISERATTWFDETKSRLNIEIFATGNSPSVGHARE